MIDNKISAAIFGCACAFLTATTVQASAENSGTSIEYHGGKAAYDRRIEQAAIRRAAQKIGELRGSLDGMDDAYIVLENELNTDQSSHLGFPIIVEPAPDRNITTGSVPIT